MVSALKHFCSDSALSLVLSRMVWCIQVDIESHCLVMIYLIKLFLLISFTLLFLAYTTFFIMGLLMSMQVPFVGFQPIRTSEHMAAAGVL